MNRKDLILAGCLINTALTLFLFLSAGKPKRLEPHVEKIMAQESVCQPSLVVPEVLPSPSALPSLPVNLPPPPPPVEKEEKKPEIAPFVSAKSEQITVKQGDSLDKIARNHSCSVDEIRKLNKLSEDRLKIGQNLLVPTGRSKSSKKQEPVETRQEDIKYYIVKNGDSPWTIAMKNHMKVEELLSLNQLDDEKAKRLKPGDKLRIR